MDSTWNFTTTSDSAPRFGNLFNNDIFNGSGYLNNLATGRNVAVDANTLNFKPVTHASMKEIWDILMHEPGRTTDFSYAGVLMWVDYFKYEYAIVDHTLFIKGVVENDRSIPAFSLPIGAMQFSESIALLRKYSEQMGIPLIFSAIPEYALPMFRTLKPRKIEELTDWSDYLYEAESLAFLKGKKNGKKRNHVNQFFNNFPNWKMIALTPENTRLAMEFMNKFELEGDNTVEAAAERALTRRLIEYIAEGDDVLKGALLIANDEVCAISIGDVKGDTGFVHVEKALRAFPGSYEMINREFANYLLTNNTGLKYINREDDAGDPGLRLAKQSYHPLTLLKKYNIIL